LFARPMDAGNALAFLRDRPDQENIGATCPSASTTSR
jgi:hypothetical protein